VITCPLGPALPLQNQYAITAADYHVLVDIYSSSYQPFLFGPGNRLFGTAELKAGLGPCLNKDKVVFVFGDNIKIHLPGNGSYSLKHSSLVF
jgi:hypothetical protein